MNFLSESVEPLKKSSPRSRPKLDSPSGLVFFWALCDNGDREDLSRQIQRFAEGGVRELVLHARNGLLVPYGGDDWFDLIRWHVDECRRYGIEAWLYDEDPYPSGSAGGWVTADAPELAAHAIERHEDDGRGGMFVFPTGHLLWAGVVDSDGRQSLDWTARVGMVRLDWDASDWDSRHYYPATPLYDCPRAVASNIRFALWRNGVPEGGRLVAFVARPVAKGIWGSFADSLNPLATEKFLDKTHRKYLRALGSRLGKTVKKIFTDEAKTFGNYPWTPGIFEDFRNQYGYELRGHLEDLFQKTEDPSAMRVRIDYREWIGRRFQDSWFAPVSRWCRKNGLHLLGHLSPEEDPVNQSALLGNLLPMQRWLSCAGFDIIVPAVGDERHPILNIGLLQAISTARQFRLPGVCSESLGVSGFPPSIELAKVMAWQAGSGVNYPVIHAAYSSRMGLRRYEAPPDLGPDGGYWAAMVHIHRHLQPFWELSFRSKQDAPVAILWPIRSFQASGEMLQPEAGGLREDLVDLVLLCLQRQIGIHLLDEEIFQSATFKDGRLQIGDASYSSILLPSTSVLDFATFDRLSQLFHAGFQVVSCGSGPQWLRPLVGSLKPRPALPWRTVSRSGWPEFLDTLPRVCELECPIRGELRASRWRKSGREILTLQNIGSQPLTAKLSGKDLSLSAGELFAFELRRKKWVEILRFDPATTPTRQEEEETAAFGSWEMQIDGTPPVVCDHPKPFWVLHPSGKGVSWIQMPLTGEASTSEEPLANSLEYSASFLLKGHFERVFFLIEPGLMRGDFELHVAGGVWEFICEDSELQSRKLEITEFLRVGENTIRLILRNPRHLDGLKWAPRVEILRTAYP